MSAAMKNLLQVAFIVEDHSTVGTSSHGKAVWEGELRLFHLVKSSAIAPAGEKYLMDAKNAALLHCSQSGR